MKKITNVFCAVVIAAIVLQGCTKGSGNYSTTDHDKFFTGTMRQWTGSIGGYALGDTIEPPATAAMPWPKAFNRTITDTAFSIQEINGFEISTLGFDFNYLLTDSTHGFIQFDTTLSGSALSFVRYSYAKDSLTLEIHQVTGFNSAANQYYQTNYYLHTPHS